MNCVIDRVVVIRNTVVSMKKKKYVFISRMVQRDDMVPVAVRFIQNIYIY